MSQFLLDTNTISFAIRGNQNVVNQLRRHHPGDICISAITLAELRFGADKRRSERLHHLIDTILLNLRVAPFDTAAAASYGRVAAELAAVGTPIGEIDTQIASHALAIGATIVTNNVKHFRKVPHLQVTDWS